MPDFKDVSSPAGLTALNNHLSTRGYVDGFRPSAEDATLYTRVPPSVNSADYPHVARWQTHVGSFCSCDRSKWAGAKSGASAAHAPTHAPAHAAHAAPAETSGSPKKGVKSEPKKSTPAESKADEEDDEPIQKWVSDDEDDESEKRIAKIAAEKIAADKAKGKVAPIEKSSLILDIKPEDSETDMAKLEADVRALAQDGLTWTEGRLVPVAFGIKKLRIMAVIIDSKVSTDDLRERIEALPGIQSTDLYAHTKL